MGMKTVLDRAKKVHFVGIGGSGVSAIARLALMQGKSVSGSDISDSETLQELRTNGARVFLGHRSGNVPPECDLLIHSIAISENNPEIGNARRNGVPLLSYPEALGQISKDKFTIAISGTHGKTTTTAMVGKLLTDAGFDPTIIVGSPMLHARSNLVVGKSKYMVVEACEYRRSFLNLSPRILVITNIDRDHLDYYADLEDIKHAFAELAEQVVPNGTLVCTPDNPRLMPVLNRTKVPVMNYELMAPLTRTLKLRLPGAHNQWNAQAAAAVGSLLKISPQVIRQSLRSFRGTKRRLEYKGVMREGVVVYDDYGHAPAEARATLAALRELFPKRHITVVFQPHLYSRTKLLLHEFGQSFLDADRLIVSDIYAAREAADESIHAKDLVSAVNKVERKAAYISDHMSILPLIRAGELKTDVLLTLGAGDIGTLADCLVR